VFAWRQSKEGYVFHAAYVEVDALVVRAVLSVTWTCGSLTPKPCTMLTIGTKFKNCLLVLSCYVRKFTTFPRHAKPLQSCQSIGANEFSHVKTVLYKCDCLYLLFNYSTHLCFSSLFQTTRLPQQQRPSCSRKWLLSTGKNEIQDCH